MKKIPINRRDGMLLISALISAGLGAVLGFFGKKITLVPMKMAARLQLGVALILLLNVLWPMLVRVCRHYLEKKEEQTEQKSFKPLSVTVAWVVRWSNVLGLVLFLAALGGVGYWYYLGARPAVRVGAVGYLHVLILLLAFAALLILSKALKHFAAQEKESGALVAMLDVLRLNLAIFAVGTVIEISGIFALGGALRILQYVMAGYCALFLLLSFVSGFVRGECATGIHLSIPRLFSHKEEDEEDLITYLEKSTGITLRSLFGIRVLKSILPAVLLGVGLFFWLSTGVVQVESYQEGALYRLGKCEKILEPGLHVTLPYPFDKVELYDTGRVNEMVVGYDNSDRTNLLWTESHGGTEYKLLLGNGSELVSVNLRVKYKIDDLREYVTASSEPEKILNAKAYAVVKDITVRTTLDQLLAEDRTKLSQSIHEKLNEYMEQIPCGLSVEGVVLESFHPPVEVSQIYQQVISTEMQAQAQKEGAQGAAEVTVTMADIKYNVLVTKAQIDQNEKVAAATAAVAEFNAMKAAYEENPDAFCYYKYLNALAKAYQGKRLYIISDGIDQKYIYFGNGVIVYNNGN